MQQILCVYREIIQINENIMDLDTTVQPVDVQALSVEIEDYIDNQKTDAERKITILTHANTVREIARERLRDAKLLARRR